MAASTVPLIVTPLSFSVMIVRPLPDDFKGRVTSLLNPFADNE